MYPVGWAGRSINCRWAKILDDNLKRKERTTVAHISIALQFFVNHEISSMWDPASIYLTSPSNCFWVRSTQYFHSSYQRRFAVPNPPA